MSVYVHKKNKYCFICKKKIHEWISWFDWDYYDYEPGERKERHGIEYTYVDKYWHKKCAWKVRPPSPYQEDKEG